MLKAFMALAYRAIVALVGRPCVCINAPLVLLAHFGAKWAQAVCLGTCCRNLEVCQNTLIGPPPTPLHGGGGRRKQ